MEYNEGSLELHKKNRGKLEIKSKVPLNNREDLALAYTPGVGAVSSEIAAHPDRVRELTIKQNTVAIISDGSSVLGLGNIGPLAAIPVMEGKAILFKQFANIDAFPICLDTQDTEEIIRTIKNIVPIFGGINLEDIAAPRCFEIERRLKAELDIPVMHDDQHGTAMVVLAALINILRVKNMDKADIKLVVNGAGAAGIAIARLLLQYGFVNIIMCDSKGVLSTDRTDIAANPEKQELLALIPPAKSGSLTDAIAGAEVFIGVSKGNVLTADMVRLMSPRPVILALANPIPEIAPQLAHEAGAYIVATGRSDFPNQINNVLAFPGIFRGALDNHVNDITNVMLTKAAETLAQLVAQPTVDNILPDIFDPRVVPAVAAQIK